MEYWIKTDLKQLPKVEKIAGVMFTQDSGADRIGYAVYDDGEPAVISGTIRANIIRADGVTLSADGEISGNNASVVLPDEAYAVPGKIGVFLKLINGETVATLGGIEAYVHKSM